MKAYLSTAVAFAMFLAGVSFAEEYEEAPVASRPMPNSSFYAGLLDPLYSVLGAGVFQQIHPALRVGIAVGTNNLGYNSALTYGVGAQYLLRPGTHLSPNLGFNVVSAEPSGGDRQIISYLSTGVEVQEANSEIVVGFGLHWSLSEISGRHLVMPYLRIGSSY